MREDAGRSQAAIARAAAINQAYLSRIEAGNAAPSVEVLMAIAAALGCDLSVRMFPGTGPRIRDRIQVAMSEALLASLHPRWRAQPEVPVYRPVRGVIDLVLTDATAHVVVPTELQSELRRVEQQIRWSVQKADALASMPELAGDRVSRLLVVRNTAAMRETVRAAARTLAAAYPARAADAIAALTADRSVAGCRPVVGERRARRGTDPRWAAARCHGRAIASCGEEDRVPVVRALVGGAVLAGAERVGRAAAVDRAGRRRRGARGRRRVLPRAPLRPPARVAVSAAGRDRRAHERRSRSAPPSSTCATRTRCTWSRTPGRPTSSPAAGSSWASAAGRRSR